MSNETTRYEPEIGQAMFGQPHQEYACGTHVEAAVLYLREELGRVMWNETQDREWGNPFDNSGGSFTCEEFEVSAYSWSDDDQPYNFRWGDVRLSWYKHCLRGLSSNMEMTPDLTAEMLRACLKALHDLDEANRGY